MSREDWRREIDNARRHEGWSLVGPNRVVKVVPLSPAGAGQSAPAALGGYFTVAKALLQKTPQEIERALGLPNGHLGGGAAIYDFMRLPMAHEYEHELTADFPDGLAFNPSHADPAYPPGSAKIHQWRLKAGVQVPVNVGTAVRLQPNQRFLRHT